MKFRNFVPLCAMAAAIPMVACGGDDTTDNGGTGGTGASTSSGTGGTTSSGTGGSTSSGTGGSTSSGTGGSTSSGTGGGDYWGGESYDPNGQPFEPAQPPGWHGPGMNNAVCGDCHDGNNEELWMYGGIVFQSDGVTGAGNVEVGVMSGGTLRATYSNADGLYWFPNDGGTIDWPSADVRIRNGNGEAMMNSEAAPSCMSCHTGGMELLEP